MLGSSALYMGILIISCFGMGRRMAGKFAGLIAALVVSMYPILFGLSRHYLLDFNLTAMTALTIWLLMETERFSRRIPSLLFGVALAFSVLTKWTLIAFVAGPLAIITLSIFVQQGDGIKASARLKNLAGALAVAYIIAAPWYAANFGTLRQFINLVANSGLAEGDPTLFSTESWLFYLRHLTQFQILAPFTFLFVIGLVLALFRRKGWLNLAALLLWIILPYIYFSLSVNKDTRYTLPYLPAMAVLTGVGLSLIRWRIPRIALTSLITAYALFEFAGLTLGLHQFIPGLPTRVESVTDIATFTHYAEDTHIATPPQTGNWNVHEMLVSVMQNAQETRVQPSNAVYRFVIMPDIPYISALTFRYWARMENLPIEIVFGSGVEDIDYQTILQNSNYVLTKTGNQGPEWTTKNGAKYSLLLANPTSELGKQFTPITQIPLPDGSTATIYRRN
jgi:4-amino-4-deoxy-L-arabinose transferase-like glycosyltransferase